jgi:hypothetical protein
MFVWGNGRGKLAARLKYRVVDMGYGRGQFGSPPPPD